MPEPTLQPQPTLGMAKTAIPIAETPPITPVEMPPKAQTTLTAPSWEGISIDLIRYLGKDIGSMTTKDIEQLKDIDKWSRSELLEDTIGNRLQKLRGLEQQLGQPGLHETKVDKLWNWIRMSFQISELQTRQRAYER